VSGAGTGPVSGTRTVAISGGGGPVPDGSEAVTVNVTVTGATAAGTVTLWATGAKPGTANVHYVAGQTVSNAAVVPLDALGRIQVNVTGGATHVVVDVAGYFRGAVNTWTHTYDTNGNRRATTGPPVKWGDSGARSYQWSTAAGLPVLAVETRPWAAGGADTFYWLYGPDHVPVAQVNPNGTLYLLHRDQLGSIALATTTGGAVALSRAWDPYGKPVASTGTALWPIPFGWAGDYRDDSGLINLRARHYDPVTGIFLQRDPITALTREPYSYVGGNPVNRTDPWGLCWGPGCWLEDATKGAVDIVGGLTGTDPYTVTQAKEWVGFGSEWLGDKITNNPIHEHLGIDANVFGLVCVGLTYQDGHFYMHSGLGAVAGVSVSPSYYSKPLDPHSCDNNPSIAAMLGPISGSVSRDMNSGGLSTDKGWSFSPGGFGLKYSLFVGAMWQKPIS
jgi:RHS repeat-associated protein